MIMKSSVVAIFACFFALHFSGTVAYLALPQPPPHLAPTPMSSTTTTPTTPLAHTDTTNGAEPLLQMKQSLLGRVFRRGKNRLQTLDKETTTATKKQQKKEDPEELWRVMFHNSEYMPERVSKVLTQVFPITRMTAFDICLRARSAGMVEVVVTDKRQAEKYCGAILRRGLTATIEPYMM